MHSDTRTHAYEQFLMLSVGFGLGLAFYVFV